MIDMPKGTWVWIDMAPLIASPQATGKVVQVEVLLDARDSDNTFYGCAKGYSALCISKGWLRKPLNFEGKTPLTDLREVSTDQRPAAPPGAQEQAGVAAQPSPHIEPAEYSDEWLLQRARKAQATIDSLPPDLRATFYAASATLPALPTTPTEGPAQPDLRGIDAGTLDEWKDLRMRGYVPKDALFLQVGDLPKVIARAIESKVRASTLTVPTGGVK